MSGMWLEARLLFKQLQPLEKWPDKLARYSFFAHSRFKPGAPWPPRPVGGALVSVSQLAGDRRSRLYLGLCHRGVSLTVDPDD